MNAQNFKNFKIGEVIEVKMPKDLNFWKNSFCIYVDHIDGGKYDDEHVFSNCNHPEYLEPDSKYSVPKYEKDSFDYRMKFLFDLVPVF